MGSFLYNSTGSRAVLEQRAWMLAAGSPQCLSLLHWSVPVPEWLVGRGSPAPASQLHEVTAASLLGAQGLHGRALGISNSQWFIILLYLAVKIPTGFLRQVLSVK